MWSINLIFASVLCVGDADFIIVRCVNGQGPSETITEQQAKKCRAYEKKPSAR